MHVSRLRAIITEIPNVMLVSNPLTLDINADLFVISTELEKLYIRKRDRGWIRRRFLVGGRKDNNGFIDQHDSAFGVAYVSGASIHHINDLGENIIVSGGSGPALSIGHDSSVYIAYAGISWRK